MNVKNIMRHLSKTITPVVKTFPQADENCWADSSTDQTCSRVLVIDVSPSMTETDWPPSRLHGALEAVEAYIKRLASENPDTLVAIVVFAEDAHILLNLTPARMHREIQDSLKSIQVADCTNMSAGLIAAFNILKSHHGQVVFLSDGDYNTGLDPRIIAQKLRQIATIETVGIGGSPDEVNEEVLKDISSPYPDGSKRYRWIGDKEKLVRHFHNLAGRIVRA